MVIIATLVALFILFFFVRKNVGPAILGAIAGLTVYEMFSSDLAAFIQSHLEGTPIELINTIIYLVLVLGMPLVLYFQSRRGGLFGLLRIVEAALITALFTILVADAISYFMPLDELSSNILSGINNFKGPILMASIAFAYFDIIFYRD